MIRGLCLIMCLCWIMALLAHILKRLGEADHDYQVKSPEPINEPRGAVERTENYYDEY